MKGKVYAAIDLKSFYASVECIERGLDPLTTNLVVADKSRTERPFALRLGQAPLGGDYVFVIFAPVPMPLPFPVELSVVVSGLLQIIRYLGTDLNGDKPPVDFDGNFRLAFSFRSVCWG